jgi:hypothetical protein
VDADVSLGMSIWGPEYLTEEEEEEEEECVSLCDSRRAKSRATRRFARKLCAIVVKIGAILRAKSAVVVVIRMRSFNFSNCLCFFWFGLE